jgi:Fungal chitosanase of glycosyl hydrolase group 75
MLSRAFLRLWAAVMVVSTAPLYCQAPGAAHHAQAALNEWPGESGCALQAEIFPLSKQDLTVLNTDGGILFTAGMTIDADGAPNAYAPNNRGLDYTANARDAHGWVALVTNESGRPVLQKNGRYRGYYVSTTSLQQGNVSDLRSPKRYIDATKVPYIALPQDFARTFDIHLGDLVVVVNQAIGRSAYAIYADVGPGGRIGKGSVALAEALGIPANPRHDSVADGIIYLVFPGSRRADDRVTTRNVKSAAARLYRRWGGRQKLRTCERSLQAE